MTPGLNDQITTYHSESPSVDWEHDIEAAIRLLEEITATGRQWDIFLHLEDGQITYEITNIFMIDEDGETLLTRGWPAGDPSIDIKCDSLPLAACRAYISFMGKKNKSLE